MAVNRNRKPENICQQWVEYAYQAVDEWDGGHNGGLIRLLAEKLGMTHADLMLIADEMQHEGEEPDDD